MTTRNQRLWRRPAVALLLAFLAWIGSVQHAAGQVSLSVTPAYAYITEQAPHGSFVLRNDGTERVEVVVSARYGVIESDVDGAATRVTLEEASWATSPGT